MRHESIVDAIGHTPLVRLRVPAPEGVEVYAKLELANAFAMKDRVARQVVTEARRSGALKPGAPIVESSSGTMALGLALVGTHLGHPVHIVTDPRIDPVTLAKLRTLGCEVHVVSAMGEQGWQSARLDLLAELMTGLPGAFWPRQYSNPQNPAAYRGLAQELVADLGTVDVVVGSVGSGGSLCGTSRALLERFPELKVVGVDAVGSVLFGQPDVPTRRQGGLGNSLHPDNIDYRLIDEVHWLSDDEAFAATRALAREQKIFAGNTSGSVYRVLTHLAAHAAPGTRLVGIMPDRGDRYVDTVYAAHADLTGDALVATEPAPVRYGELVHSWSYAEISRRERPLLLFVESNTTGTGMLALTTAVRLGLEPVLFVVDPSRYQGLAGTGARVVVCDTDDPELLRKAAEEAADGREVAGVTTTSEYYLVQAAALAEELGVPANPAAALAACRDKSATRRTLSAHGVRQPRFAEVRDPAEVAAAVAAVGLPCVVKPVDESGSHEVLWCEDVATATEQARRLLAVTRNVRGQASARTVLVEEYLTGPEFSAEMFLTDGEAVCVGITQRTVSELPYFVETGHLFPAVLPEETAAAMADTARRALAAVGLERGPAHVELRLTADGPAVIEINARLAGGMIPELIRPATGIDLLDQQIRAAAGLPLNLAPERARSAGIRFLLAAEEGRLAAVEGVGRAGAVAGVERVTVTAAVGRPVRPVRESYDRLGHVIAVGEGPEQVTGALDAALAELTVVVEPAE
ncbi:pyridoxal-phosphate dependent enzyme [Streptomyces sp. CBMA123]|uniref:pyridoxal-phosphate dependent enzyme n=1 Tax=Streptomyces sp. CBMA123 TaxID=1896313 RepID=UPI0016620B7E|nr:pyridoxal-phosphate dependent enzyme [Streptomyces sp. CBMA123]MBD0693874.1 pyridoxal-5'-phosphate-dependent protein [Streptomyces sp. CBMA123]